MRRIQRPLILQSSKILQSSTHVQLGVLEQSIRAKKVPSHRTVMFVNAAIMTSNTNDVWDVYCCQPLPGVSPVEGTSVKQRAAATSSASCTPCTLLSI